jgi:outer membrane receptor protein involved in Fe transport
LTNTAYTGCVPLNPFGVNSESQAALNYITTQIGWKTTLESDNLVGSISGSPFSTWAGPVNIALSAEWRRTTEEIISNALPTARANCAGISFNCNANTPQYGVATGSSSVANLPRSTVTVREFAGEVQIPLLRDVTMFKALDVNLAIRHAHYNLAGDAVTWKAGVVWQPAEMLTLRGTLSRDFRAPTIDELFRPTAFSLTNFTDTISGTGVNAPNVATYNGGNPNLKPEIANTLALGIVLKPTNNLSFSLDYFNIKIKNFIFLVQGNSPPEQNICYASKGASPYCALITRGLGLYDPAAAGALTAANAVTAWYQQPINIAQQSTKGFDFEANWRPRIFDRPLGLRFLTTYQPSILFKRAGIVDNDYAGVAFGTNGIQATPKWRVSLFVDFKPTDDITISILERWRSSLKFHSDPTIVVASPNVKDVAYTNLNLAFDIPVGNAKVQTFFNVANLFNVTPPQAGFWGNPNPGQFGEFVLGDDVIGRYFTAGIRAKF